MLKKVFAFLISVSLILMPVQIVPAKILDSDFLDEAIKMLADMTPEDRMMYLSVTAPFLATDDGIDIIVELVESYDGEEDDIFDKLTGLLLNIVDKDMLLEKLPTIKAIEEGIREKYLEILLLKLPIEIPDDVLDGANILYEKILSENTKLAKICEEDNITVDVFANIMQVLYDLNDKKAPLSYKSGKFSVISVSKSLESRFEEYLDDSSAQEFYEKIAEYLNDSFAASDKEKVKKFLESIKVASISGSSNNTKPGNTGGDGGGNGGGKVEDNEEKEDVKENQKSEIITIKNDQYMLYSFAANEDEILYKINEDNSLTPVKHSYYKDGKIYARLMNGNFTIKKANPMPFTDVSGWSEPYIRDLYIRNIISGKSSESFAPKDTIKREEFVKLVVELMDILDKEAKCGFEDVDTASWFYPYVASAYQKGIINGISETHFGSGLDIKREDIAKIVYSIILKMGMKPPLDKTPKDIDEVSDYAKESVTALYSLGIISGDQNGNFNPKSNATREETAKIIANLLTLFVSNTPQAIEA